MIASATRVENAAPGSRWPHDLPPSDTRTTFAHGCRQKTISSCHVRQGSVLRRKGLTHARCTSPRRRSGASPHRRSGRAPSLSRTRDCVRQFNGMWAFALYDEAARQLFLSRDRFGEKPLHYFLEEGRLIFASEIKAILAHPVRRRANREVVSDYLYKGEAQGRLESFFEDIVMLPPAHNAVFDLRTK